MTKRTINLAFGVEERRKGNTQKLLRKSERTFLQHDGRDYFSDEPQGQAFLGAKTAAQEAQLFGGCRTYQPGKTHGGSIGYHTLFDGGNTEDGVGARNAQIARQSQLETAAQTISLNGGNRD